MCVLVCLVNLHSINISRGVVYPINCGGTFFTDPKFLGGSKGYAGCTAGHASRPLLTLQAFQKVHRVRAAAPGMPEVSASRKKN